MSSQRMEGFAFVRLLQENHSAAFFLLSFFLPSCFLFLFLWVGKESRAVHGQIGIPLINWLLSQHCSATRVSPRPPLSSSSPAPPSLSVSLFLSLPSSLFSRSLSPISLTAAGELLLLRDIFVSLSPRQEDVSPWGKFPKWFGLEPIWELPVKFNMHCLFELFVYATTGAKTKVEYKIAHYNVPGKIHYAYQQDMMPPLSSLANM